MAIELDRVTASARVEAGYMPLAHYLELFGTEAAREPAAPGCARGERLSCTTSHHALVDFDTVSEIRGRAALSAISTRILVLHLSRDSP
jgi:hypothetical protein